MKRPGGLIIPLVLASFLALGLAATHVLRDAEASTAATLQHPSAVCNAFGANVNLSWIPASGASEQWIEYSLHDNGFAEGTYGVIPLAREQTSYSLQSPDGYLPNFWRVVSLTASGTIPSNTGAFTPCGGPILLWGPMECESLYTAEVRFRWAPLANRTGSQVLEIDTTPEFNSSDFRTTAPMSAHANSLRRTDFQNDITYYFRIVLVQENGTRLLSQNGWFTPDCLPRMNSEIYGSEDWLVIPSIGVSAPVNVQDVGWGDQLGVPLGGHDVLRYNFPLFPSMQGTPGGPGPTLIAGHLDYYVIGPAVFWNLAKLQAGDVIEYWVGGTQYRYVVDWMLHLPHDASLTSYVEQSQGDTLLLVTCFGQFDRAQFGGYNQRTLVHAVRQ